MNIYDRFYRPKERGDLCGGSWYYENSVSGYRYIFNHGELTVDKLTSTQEKPREGQETGRQAERFEFGEIVVDDNIPRPPPGDYPIYRLMSSHDTLSLVEGIIVGQVMSGSVGIKAREGTSDQVVKFYHGVMMPHIKFLVRECLRALSLMWQPFECIWGEQTIEGFSGTQQVIVEYKPLMPDYTLPWVDKLSNLAGLRNTGLTYQQIDIWGPKAFAYGWDTEAKRIIGRSRHENCRSTSWWGWILANEEGIKLDRKASGRVYTVAGPPDAAAQSKLIAQNLASGKSAYMANLTVGVNQRNVDAKVLSDLAKVTGYFIQQWDNGNYASSQDAIINKLRYYDANMFRAWKRPERSGTEGQRGTLADASEHGGVAKTDSDFIFADILNKISKGPGDAQLVNKFGPEARGAAWLDPGTLTALNAETDMVIIDAALTDPFIRAQVMEQIDLDAIMDRRNIPKLKTVLAIVVKGLAEQQKALMQGPPPTNGNSKPSVPNGNGAVKNKDGYTRRKTRRIL